MRLLGIVSIVSIQLALLNHVSGYGMEDYYYSEETEEAAKSSRFDNLNPFFLPYFMPHFVAQPQQVAIGHYATPARTSHLEDMRSNIKNLAASNNFQNYQLNDYSPAYSPVSSKFYWLFNRPAPTVGTDAVNVDRPSSLWQSFLQFFYPPPSPSVVSPSIRPVFVRSTRTAVITVTERLNSVNTRVTSCIPLSLFINTVNPTTCTASPGRLLLLRNVGVIDPRQDESTQLIEPTPIHQLDKVETTVEPALINNRQPDLESSVAAFDAGQQDAANDDDNALINQPSLRRVPRRFVLDVTTTRFTTNTLVFISTKDVTSTINLAMKPSVLQCILPGMTVCSSSA